MLSPTGESMAESLISKYEEYLRFELCRSEHTVRAYISDLRDFAIWTAGNISAFRADLISSSDIRAWIASLSKKSEKPASIRRRLQSLRSFYRYLCRMRIITTNPADELPAPRLPSKLPQFVKTAEMESLLEKEDQENADRETDSDSFTRLRDNLIIELLYATGMRRAELLNIDDGDIDKTRCEVKILGKRRKQRILPLPPHLLEKIAEYQELRDKEIPATEEEEATGSRPLLITPLGRMSESTLYRIVRRELRPTATGRKSPHTLRHTFATSMLNAGADLNDVKEFLGHSSLATTQIYTHVSFTELMEAYDRSHPRSAGSGESREQKKK